MFYECNRLLQMEIPADSVDFMYTAVTSYNLICFTMHALPFTFTVSYRNLCVNSNQALFLTFQPSYPVSFSLEHSYMRIGLLSIILHSETVQFSFF